MLGNEGPAATETIEFIGSLPPPSRLSLDSDDDTGESASDGIINKTTGISVSGVARPGASVQIFDDRNNDNIIDDGELLAELDANSTTGEFSENVSLGSGAHFLRAIASDEFGNRSLASPSLQLFVDVQAPEPVQSITLRSNSDTGFRNDDRYTAEKRPELRTPAREPSGR